MYSVLTVDDSASMRQMAAFTLKSAGFNVLEAAGGQEGSKRAREKSVDLLLVDQNMPRMDGISLVRELRNLPQYKSAPLLMLTVESSDAMKAAGQDAGATGWSSRLIRSV